MSEPFNPYAAPQVAEIREKPTDDESVRREYLSHEASVRSIGSLYAAAFVILCIALPLILFVGRPNAEQVIPLLVFWTCFAALTGTMAYGLRRLESWARGMGIVLAIVWLCVSIPCTFVLGPLLNLYVLYLLGSRKGSMVFSPEYRRVMNATPEIRYRTATSLLVVTVMSVAVLIGGLIAVIVLA